MLDCFTAPRFPLKYLDVWENVFSMSPAFFIAFLKKCPQIAHIHFALGRQFDVDESWPDDRITMSHLRYLNFESFAGTNPMFLLRSLHLPALETLHFNEFTDVGAESPDHSFKRQLIWYFLPETSASLKTLVLHGGCIPIGNNIVEPLLIRMRNIETLSFLKTEVKPSFLELLIPPKDDPEQAWVMPHLNSIHLVETDIEGDALFRVIQSRALSDKEMEIIHAAAMNPLSAVLALKSNLLYRKTLREVRISRCAVLEDATFSAWLAVKETHSTVVRAL
jgi:hypothetical protein